MLTPEQEYRIFQRLDAEDREAFSQMTPAEREHIAEQLWVTDAFMQRYPQWGDINSETNSKLLTQTVEQAVANGATYDSDLLSACYHSLNAQGKFEHPQAEEFTPQSGEEYLQSRRVEELVKAEPEMTDAELAKALNRIAGIYVRGTI